MTAFVVTAALCLIVALLLIAWPLLRRREVVGRGDRRGTNVELYRQRLAEIERERDAGAMSPAEAATLSAELAATLLEDAGAKDATLTSHGPGAWAAATIGIAIVVVSIALYRELGAYDTVQLAAATRVLNQSDADPAALDDLVKRLRTRVARHADDAESWYLLGHTLMRLDDASGAASAFERTYALAGDDVAVEVALAHARFVADGGTISRQNRALIDRILAADANEPFVQEMVAIDAFRRADYPAATRALETALASGAAGARTAELQAGLQRARAMMGNVGPALDVTVELGDAAQRLPPTAALFVYARRPGERMPLLVARRSVAEASVTVRLDRANAMQGDVTLQPGETLDVAARLSASGALTTGSDDPQARAAAVKLGDGVTPVRLALEAAGAESPPNVAAAAMPAPASSPPGAAAGAASIAVDVAFAPGVDAQSPARVFVIARMPNGPPMPIAVRALDPASLPQALVLTDADSMQPQRRLSQFDRVEVVARLSRSGSPMRQPGDIESAPQLIDPRATVKTALIIGG